MKTTHAIAAAATFLIAACGGDAGSDVDTDLAGDTTPIVQTPTEAGGERATAMLRDSAGNDVGTVTIEAMDGGAQLSARVQGIAPGEHGIHIHAVGQCDAAAGFESAGSHLNPTNAQHGLDNANGPHLGDMPNLTVADDSTGTIEFTNDALQLGQGGNLLDADGAAVVVHAGQDDQTTDPSGDSGARIACGVVQAG